VVERILPKELVARGITDADALCGRLKTGLGTDQAGATAESPDVVFQRLAGGR
jgi:hypothetical protein